MYHYKFLLNHLEYDKKWKGGFSVQALIKNLAKSHGRQWKRLAHRSLPPSSYCPCLPSKYLKTTARQIKTAPKFVVCHVFTTLLLKPIKDNILTLRLQGDCDFCRGLLPLCSPGVYDGGTPGSLQDLAFLVLQHRKDDRNQNLCLFISVPFSYSQ